MQMQHRRRPERKEQKVKGTSNLLCESSGSRYAAIAEVTEDNKVVPETLIELMREEPNQPNVGRNDIQKEKIQEKPSKQKGKGKGTKGKSTATAGEKDVEGDEHTKGNVRELHRMTTKDNTQMENRKDLSKNMGRHTAVTIQQGNKTIEEIEMSQTAPHIDKPKESPSGRGKEASKTQSKMGFKIQQGLAMSLGGGKRDCIKPNVKEVARIFKEALDHLPP